MRPRLDRRWLNQIRRLSSKAAGDLEPRSAAMRVPTNEINPAAATVFWVGNQRWVSRAIASVNPPKNQLAPRGSPSPVEAPIATEPITTVQPRILPAHRTKDGMGFKGAPGVAMLFGQRTPERSFWPPEAIVRVSERFGIIGEHRLSCSPGDIAVGSKP